MSKSHELQRIIHWYMEETGIFGSKMSDIAAFAVSKGYELPPPADPLERLAKQLARAAREETRRDQTTGRPYRVNHAFPVVQSNGQYLMLWVNIDEAPRNVMEKSLVNRREQMVGDALSLDHDAEHWNNMHPDEEPIQLPLDFTDDVEWKKNEPLEDAG